MNTPQQHKSAPTRSRSQKAPNGIEPETLAEQMGIHIIETSELDPRFNGMYLHNHKVIVMRSNLDYWTRRSCLAHELGHAHYGDEIHGDPRAEARADRFAAHLLIDEESYRAAERLHDGHEGAIALDLGITPAYCASGSVPQSTELSAHEHHKDMS